MAARAYPPFSARRPLVCVAAAYGAGILSARFMAFRPLYGALGLAAALIFLVVFRYDRRRVYALSAAFFCAGLVYAGALLAPNAPPEGAYDITGYVSGEERLTSGGRRAVMLTDVELTDENGKAYRIGRLYWSFTPDDGEMILLTDGRQIAFSGRLYAPSPQMNPHGFDFRMYLLAQGVRSGASGCKNLRETGLERLNFTGAALRARQALEALITRVYGEHAALPKALLLGVRDEMPEDVTEQFAQSGITHILAVSGLHVGLLAGMLTLVLRALRVPRKPRFCVMLVFLALYCALLNFSAPVLRASVLFLLAEIGRLRRRRRDGLTLLASTFLLILLLRPLDLFTASFQLSFAAVLGIALLSRRFTRRLSFIRWRAARGAIAATAAAVYSTALPVAALFHRFSPIGLIASPVVCALLMPLLMLYALSLAVGALWLPAGRLIALPAIALTGGMTEIARVSAGLPFASLIVPAPNAAWFALAFVAALALSGYLLWTAKRRALACLALALLALTVDIASVRREVTYIQFSVSQQDAALLVDGRETVLFDAAQNGGDIADFLLSTGLNADTVILSHLHNDHCMGLRDLIAAGVRVGRVLLPARAEETLADPECLALLDEIERAGVPIGRYTAGDVVETPRAALTALFPDAAKTRAGADANLYAAAFLLETSGTRMLLMSDTSGIYEDYVAVPADILKVAHHGSAGSTGEKFLAAVAPAAAIVSCGPANAALPSPKLIERLDRAVPSWYRTDVSGALTITFTARGATVAPFLAARDP